MSQAPGSVNNAPQPAAGSSRESVRDSLRAFWDFFVLFSGISTASNLSRTRRQRILKRGFFLFRQPRR